MRPSQLVGLELKRLSRNRFAALAAVVIMLIPLLYSSLYLYAFWDPYEHLERMHVAIVNQDVPAARQEQTVKAGQELVAKLKDDSSVGWKFTTQEDAFAGLNTSKYDLAVVIPKDFSQSILNTTKDSATGQAAPKAKLLYYSNPSKNYLAEQIGNKVIAKLQEDLNGQIAGNFLENVFGNLDDMKINLQVATDGSKELSQGIDKAYGGSGQITQHLQEAASGSQTLNDGVKALKDGSQKVAQGNADLEEGSVQLHAGSVTVQDGVNQAYNGSVKLADGSDELVKGLNQANTSLQDAAVGSAKLYDGLKSGYEGSIDLKAGLSKAYNGSLQVEDGSTQINGGLVQMQSQLNHPTQGVPALIAGTDQAVKATGEQGSLLLGVLKLHATLSQQLTPGVQSARGGLAQINPVLQATQGNLSTALASLEALNSTDPAVLEAIDQIQKAQANVAPQSGMIAQITSQVDSGLALVSGGIAAVDAGLYNPQDDLQKPQTIWGGVKALNVGLTTLDQGLQQLLKGSNDALDQLVPGSARLKSGSTDLTSGLAAAYSGSSTLTEGLHDLTTGGSELSSGLVNGASAFPGLVEGGQSLQKGLNQLKSGFKDLSDGMNTFVGKLGDLVSGAKTLADGSKSLEDGMNQTAVGSESLLQGIVALHDGSASLTDGLSQARTGSLDLHNGLQDGVAQLQKDLPNHPDTVSKAMGQPVQVDETQIHPVKNYGTGFAPYFVPLSLWVGALMLFFLVGLKENSLRASGVSKIRILFGKYLTVALFGSAQAIISSFVLITILGLQPQNILAFYGFNILQSLAYSAIIFMLVELFDMAGRFVAIVLLMLQLTSGGGTYPVFLVPKFFQAIHPYLPMTYGIAALRQIISGSAEIPLHTSVLMLIGFGVGALLIAILLTPKWLGIKDLHPQPQLGA
ncbi:YhgE/Pip domain-containing protein [Desulfosporosinus sp. Sb-LF]|uniref:YhgE/Pip domain-containing protein n=1 Tax=Desulfosporosinus sp. Sb-LF TaxID=2560027 RepID=UPI00107F43C0|nr:YhgE/Pip domain-containing protein [Desulfosporosinus sp. Sb-LF]TGE31390.1 YhgE/Pip domain-containing protein [Desulfosporosinus sp. Sb-LF]